MKGTRLFLTSLAIGLLTIGTTTVSAQVSGLITPQQAVSAALTSINGQVMGIELDDFGFMDATPVYSVDILAGNVEYDIDVNAITGEVLRTERDMVDSPMELQVLSSAKISYEQAQQIALASLPNGKSFSVSLDEEGGQAIYDVEVIMPDATSYEVMVNAVTGAIVHSKPEFYGAKPTMSVAEAEAKALQVKAGTVIKTKLDSDDGQIFYEVDILTNNKTYSEVKVNAMTGMVYAR